MTTFVLVPGPFTGGWVWEETASLLRAAGEEAYPVTLPGLGDRRLPDGAGVDLETHVQDLVRLIDGIPVPRVVLVGHGYGLHPVLGAADRRPARVARIVSLDTGLPADGEPAARSVPDPGARARLAAADASGHDGGWIAPPEPGGWSRWGSTEDVPAAALDRLERLASPQPVRTFTSPLRPTGAAADLPTTGVLCTANGSSVDLVRMLVEAGPPQFRELGDDRFRFVDLATGHWPMLSAPGELAEVLRRAAAGEGHRMTAPDGPHERPSHLLPFLVDLPEVPRERLGRVDLHLPDTGTGTGTYAGTYAGTGTDTGTGIGIGTGTATDTDSGTGTDTDTETDTDTKTDTGTGPGTRKETAFGTASDPGVPRPAVVFVHGGPVAPDQRPTPRDTPFLLGYARWAARLGAVGVTLDHRLHGLGDFPRAADDLAEAVALVRAHPRVDGDRIALWFFSTGGLLAADWLAAPPPWLRCLAASYPALAPLPGWGAVESRFRPADVVGTADGPPVVLTRAGREHPAFAATVAAFLAAAEGNGADVEIVDVPHGRHSFELVDPGEESRACVERAMRSVLGHLEDPPRHPGGADEPARRP
ncbi:alpha/beta fold hydrolase [Streptomyces sp. NPDC004330]|uniref:alpha/beta fold hydrolase n=1 Tax=Streptomyces sp. NPDC004330 TaxID=3364700 RepID=UPI0036983D08